MSDEKTFIQPRPLDLVDDDVEGRIAFVEAVLRRLGINHETARHGAHYTVSESRAERGEASHGHTKNLFLKDKKGRYFLLTACDDAEIDLKGLHRALGASGRVSFGTAEAMTERLSVTPGAVTALAAICADPESVQFALDSCLLDGESVHCHPLTNRATTTLKPADLLRLFEAFGHRPIVLKPNELSST